MIAFHVNSTRPFIERNCGPYFISDYELLTTVLSALKWKEKNGTIKLYTDNIGLAYYQKIGITHIWDEIDVSVLENNNYSINHRSFWAAGKIIALAAQTQPCVMMDTDFVVWNNIEDLIKKNDELRVIHREDLFPGVYLDKHLLKTASNYTFNENWSWEELPCNTAFVYFGNVEFAQYYAKESIRFMNDNFENAEDTISQMVFAEQRIIAMCAKKKNIKIEAFSNYNSLDNQNDFTHVWGVKNILNENEDMRLKFCNRLINRITVDFPQYKDMLYNVESLRKYTVC